MEYEVMYEISRIQLPITLIISVIMLIGGVITLYFSVHDIHEGIEKVSNIIELILSIIVIVVAILCGISTILNGGDDKQLLARKYYNGDYKIVVGEVTNLREKEFSQKFIVDGVPFYLSHTDETIWMIEEEGQQVRISYIPGNLEENIFHSIVKLEIRNKI